MDRDKIYAMCFIKLAPRSLERFLEQIKGIPQITRYSVLTGEFDGVLEIEVARMPELYKVFKKIDQFEGIAATNTHIVMRRFEGPDLQLPDSGHP
jgi:DNA-binding Lrp family transcriptional regulator